MWQRGDIAIGNDKSNISLGISEMREVGYPEGTKKFYRKGGIGAFF